MSYIWQDFNIKTFPAETIVFRNGVFCPELSTLESPEISKNYDLPVHIIYVGELAGKNDLDIVIGENIKNQKIYFSGKIKINKNTKLNTSIKNNGLNSDLIGFFIIENHADLDFNINAHHLCKNTGISIKTRLLAYTGSISKLTGTAYIYKYCDNCRSNIDFSAMSDKNTKIIFSPQQKISAIPDYAEHSANIAHYTQQQIEYLYQAGLTDIEVKNTLKQAFIDNIDF